MQPKPLKFMGSSREGKSLGDVTTASGVNERSNNSIRRNRNVKYIKVTSDVLNLICAAASWWLRSIKKRKTPELIQFYDALLHMQIIQISPQHNISILLSSFSLS